MSGLASVRRDGSASGFRSTCSGSRGLVLILILLVSGMDSNSAQSSSSRTAALAPSLEIDCFSLLNRFSRSVAKPEAELGPYTGDFLGKLTAKALFGSNHHVCGLAASDA